MTALVRIGTRGSPLALAQAAELRRRLAAAHPELAAPGAVAVLAIRTTGDRVRTRALAGLGGKGLFTKEIEEALLAGAIDLAVHSMKDVPTSLPDALAIPCLLPREDPRDAFLSPRADGIDGLKPGATLGTSSLRRAALMLHRRPDLRVVEFRGNVDTRLRKLADGVADATLLAMAGLKRLGQAAAATRVLTPDEMLPAPCQGTIGIECRVGDGRARDWLAPLNHAETAGCAAAERALLAALDGSCRTPIAALAEMLPEGLTLRAQIVKPDGSALIEARRHGAAGDAERLGADAADELRRRGGAGFFA